MTDAPRAFARNVLEPNKSPTPPVCRPGNSRCNSRVFGVTGRISSQFTAASELNETTLASHASVHVHNQHLPSHSAATPEVYVVGAGFIWCACQPPLHSLNHSPGRWSYLPLATGELNVDEPAGVGDPLLRAALGGLYRKTWSALCSAS